MSGTTRRFFFVYPTMRSRQVGAARLAAVASWMTCGSSEPRADVEEEALERSGSAVCSERLAEGREVRPGGPIGAPASNPRHASDQVVEPQDLDYLVVPAIARSHLLPGLVRDLNS